MRLKRIFCGFLVLWSLTSYAGLQVPMSLSCGGQSGRFIGTIDLDDTIYGLLLTPHLHGLPPGVHGFHVVSCSICPPGNAVHYDPLGTDRHRGPFKGNGHLGDLPVLIVSATGWASMPVLAPRLKRLEVAGLTLMVDVDKDNYADEPYLNGGGGGHLACGKVPYY